MIRQRVAIIYWVLFIAFLCVQTVVIRMLVMRSFSRLEQAEIVQNFRRFTNHVEKTFDQLRRTTVDWAWWDETYGFVTGHQPSFVKQNLSGEAVRYLDIDFAVLADCRGRIKFSGMFDQAAGVWDTLPRSVRRLCIRYAPPCTSAVVQKAMSGLILADTEAYLIAYSSVIPSMDTSLVAGYIAFGRRISGIGTGAVISDAEGAITLHSFSRNLPADYAHMLSRGTSIDSIAVRTVKRDSVISYKVLRDIQGQPALVVRIASRRDIYHSGWVVVTAANHVVGFILVVFGFLLWSLSRTARRSEEALLRSEKLNSLGVVAGGIAHDFNNLLTGIFGFVNLAQTEVAGNAGAEKDLAEAARAIRRARHLTQQLLTFAKGGEPLKKPVSMNRLLRESVSFAMSGSATRYEFSIPDDLWLCRADENQIGEVVDNIVINARQAMNETGVIRIIAVNVPAAAPHPRDLGNGDFVRVSIRDEGAGIPANLLTKVFDPFFTTKEKGSGLGLAVAYSIIQKHQGHIELQSKAGEGTDVIFYLPASPALREPEPAAPPDVGPARGVVLVVDDDDLVLSACSRMLMRIGYAVESAHNLDEAAGVMERYRKSGVPLVVGIIDLTIKGGAGGVQVMERLRQMEPMFTAIISSGYSESPIMADPGRFGAFATLPKPYTYEELSRVVSEAFKQVQTRAR